MRWKTGGQYHDKRNFMFELRVLQFDGEIRSGRQNLEPNVKRMDTAKHSLLIPLNVSWAETRANLS